MRRPHRPLLTLACVAAALVTLAATAPPVLADANAVIKDCNNNGRLTQHYSTHDLQRALSIMPASIKQYTNCLDVIHRQLDLQLSGKDNGGGGGSGGSFLPTPVIVILVLLALAAVTFGAVAVRRRRGEG
jgi:hypothetical protein